MHTSGNKLNIDKICIRLKDHAFCPLCEKMVRLVSFGDSAKLLHADESHVTDMSAMYLLHRLHNKYGRVMICSDSLFTALSTQPTRRLTMSAASSGKLE